MRIAVTGHAGFIGSHLVRRLIELGHEVVGIDCLLPNLYPSEVKAQRLEELERDCADLVSHVADLRTCDIAPLIVGCDVVINEAAMPGLMKSWSEFSTYVSCNLTAVEAISRACVETGVGRLVQVSTSSVYGRLATCDETGVTEPFSPYGVSKLAAEKLIHSYAANFGLESVILRYFSVYGPGQRPDMAYHRFCESLLNDREIVVFGDGNQSRTNTYVADCVDATIAAMTRGEPGGIYNISGASPLRLLDAIDLLGQALGASPRLRFEPARPGDQRETVGVIEKAADHLGYVPQVAPDVGLQLQAEWHARNKS